MSRKPPTPDESSAVERGVGRVARNRMRIAWMYYVEGLTQSEIADRLGIGRVTVVRNINEALQQREVKIWIASNVAECFALEAELKKTFNLADSVVVPEPALPENTAKVIGTAAGIYISGQLRDNARLGVGWGRTLSESLQTLAAPAFSGMEVVSLLGGIVTARKFNPAEFAWQFSDIIGADCYLLAAPAVVDSTDTKRALIDKCGLSEVLKRAENLDMVLLSVGALSMQSTTFRIGFFSDEDRQSLARAGAVGDVLLNFYDLEGRLVAHPLNDRVMSADIAMLRKAPRRVIISGGNDKVDALLGAIRYAQSNVLITNEATAEALLRRQSEA